MEDYEKALALARDIAPLNYKDGVTEVLAAALIHAEAERKSLATKAATVDNINSAYVDKLALCEDLQSEVARLREVVGKAVEICHTEANKHLENAQSSEPSRARRGRAMMGGPLRCATAIAVLTQDKEKEENQ